MIKCPSCGYENVPGTQFCEGCGEELVQDAAPGGAAASAPAADGGMVQCPACDNMNPAENVVCEVCGTELKPGGAAATAPTATAPTATAPTATAPTATAPADAAPVDQPDASKVGLAAMDVTAVAPGVDATMSTPPMTPFDTSFDLPPMVADAVAGPDVMVPMPPARPDVAAPDVPAPDAAAAPAATPAGDLQPGRVKLVVEQGMTVGQQFVLGDPEIQVGREDEEEEIYPDIDLSDQDAGYVHRRHATLRFENGNLTVTHLGGVNKTRVNNRPLPDNVAQPVKLGDKIAFGKVVLRLQPV